VGISFENVKNCHTLIYLYDGVDAKIKGNEMGMNINLTPHLEELVRRKVESGLYSSASEVVREALRLMDEKDQLRAAKLEQLRQDLQDGLDSGPAVPWDPADIKRMGRAKRIAKASSET
jgi:antitoxin ParD1/3/4